MNTHCALIATVVFVLLTGCGNRTSKSSKTPIAPGAELIAFAADVAAEPMVANPNSVGFAFEPWSVGMERKLTNGPKAVELMLLDVFRDGQRHFLTALDFGLRTTFILELPQGSPLVSENDGGILATCMAKVRVDSVVRIKDPKEDGPSFEAKGVLIEIRNLQIVR